MNLLLKHLMKRCNGCNERISHCTCSPEHVLDLCSCFCWKYGTKRCPYNANAKREVGTCEHTSVIGILDMTEEQVQLQEDDYKRRIFGIPMTREIRKIHGIAQFAPVPT